MSQAPSFYATGVPSSEIAPERHCPRDDCVRGSACGAGGCAGYEGGGARWLPPVAAAADVSWIPIAPLLPAYAPRIDVLLTMLPADAAVAQRRHPAW
eukprot:gene14706-biopygen3191